jgi:hypothetical protein
MEAGRGWKLAEDSEDRSSDWQRIEAGRIEARRSYLKSIPAATAVAHAAGAAGEIIIMSRFKRALTVTVTRR